MPGTPVIAKRVSFACSTPPSTPPSTSPSPKSPSTLPRSGPLSNRHQKEQALARTPTRRLYQDTVTIYVGAERQAFQLHRGKLCHASPFFAAAFDRDYNFSESSSGTLALPEIRPTDFEFLVQWLYEKNLEHEELDAQKPAYFRLIRLYIIADLLRMEALRNDIIDSVVRICEKRNSVPTPDDTRLIEDQVREKTALRMLIVDLFVYKKTDQLVENHQDSWSENFLREIFCELKRAQGIKKQAPFRDAKLKCRKYHEHRETPPCFKDEEGKDGSKSP